MVNNAAANPNFNPTGKCDGETKPSINPATSSMGTDPKKSFALRFPARTSDSARGKAPGNNNPRAIPNPAPPAINIAGNSSTPCGATKLHSDKLIPPCQQVVPTTPISNPFSRIIHSVPIPAVIPSAKVVNDTVKLFVVISLEATGLMVTIESVHILCCSMLSTIRGPRICRENEASLRHKRQPTTAAAQKISSAANVSAKVFRKIAG